MFYSFLVLIFNYNLFYFKRILAVFILANYFHLIDETRLTLNYMVSSLLYEEALSFPIELVCLEFGYLVASIAFEVDSLTD